METNLSNYSVITSNCETQGERYHNLLIRIIGLEDREAKREKQTRFIIQNNENLNDLTELQYESNVSKRLRLNDSINISENALINNNNNNNNKQMSAKKKISEERQVGQCTAIVRALIEKVEELETKLNYETQERLILQKNVEILQNQLYKEREEDEQVNTSPNSLINNNENNNSERDFKIANQDYSFFVNERGLETNNNEKNNILTEVSNIIIKKEFPEEEKNNKTRVETSSLVFQSINSNIVNMSRNNSYSDSNNSIISTSSSCAVKSLKETENEYELKNNKINIKKNISSTNSSVVPLVRRLKPLTPLRQINNNNNNNSNENESEDSTILKKKNSFYQTPPTIPDQNYLPPLGKSNNIISPQLNKDLKNNSSKIISQVSINTYNNNNNNNNNKRKKSVSLSPLQNQTRNNSTREDDVNVNESSIIDFIPHLSRKQNIKENNYESNGSRSSLYSLPQLGKKIGERTGARLISFTSSLTNNNNNNNNNINNNNNNNSAGIDPRRASDNYFLNTNSKSSTTYTLNSASTIIEELKEEENNNNNNNNNNRMLIHRPPPLDINCLIITHAEVLKIQLRRMAAMLAEEEEEVENEIINKENEMINKENEKKEIREVNEESCKRFISAMHSPQTPTISFGQLPNIIEPTRKQKQKEILNKEKQKCNEKEKEEVQIQEKQQFQQKTLTLLPRGRSRLSRRSISPLWRQDQMQRRE